MSQYRANVFDVGTILRQRWAHVNSVAGEYPPRTASESAVNKHDAEGRLEAHLFVFSFFQLACFLYQAGKTLSVTDIFMTHCTVYLFQTAAQTCCPVWPQLYGRNVCVRMIVDICLEFFSTLYNIIKIKFGGVDITAHNSDNILSSHTTKCRTLCPDFRYLSSFKLELGQCLVLTDSFRNLAPEKHIHPSKQETLTQCCCKVGPSSATLAQLYSSIGSTSRACWDVSVCTIYYSSLHDKSTVQYCRCDLWTVIPGHDVSRAALLPTPRSRLSHS